MFGLFRSGLFDPITLNRDTYPWDIYKGIKKEVPEKEEPKNEVHILSEADIKDIHKANTTFANSIQEQLEYLSKQDKMIIKRLV